MQFNMNLRWKWPIQSVLPSEQKPQHHAEEQGADYQFVTQLKHNIISL